jgi:hypothetical protein
MASRTALLSPLLLTCSLAACSAETGNLRLTSGGSASSYVEGFSGGSADNPSAMRFKPSVCDQVDVHPEYKTLDESALLAFLKQQGLETRVTRARGDLVYVDVTNGGTTEPVRLRVAILKNAPDAGRELHEAVLQHGPGSWGVHRANLAVLGPIGGIDDTITFAVKTKLACWGVMTMAGRDDTFVVPGAYMEL